MAGARARGGAWDSDYGKGLGFIEPIVKSNNYVI